jgi:hypothetical protein
MFKNRTIVGGFDVTFDCVGSAHTVQDSLRWTRAGGTVVLVGVSLQPLRVDLSPVWYQEVRLIGIVAHGMEMWNGVRRPRRAAVGHRQSAVKLEVKPMTYDTGLRYGQAAHVHIARLHSRGSSATGPPSTGPIALRDRSWRGIVYSIQEEKNHAMRT